VVATTSILGDVVSNVVGDAAVVEVIMPAGTDPHEFQPSPRHVSAINNADLVVANGLGLEAALVDTVEAAEADGVAVLELAGDLDPLPFAEGEDHEGEEEQHADEHGEGDPHFWFDPTRVARAVDLIAQRLATVAPEIDWTARADIYRQEVLAIDTEVERILSAVPPDRRTLVTNHDALGYFADRYGFEVIGTVIPGGGTEAEPSARDLADLVALLEAEDVAVIFAENINPSGLAETVAAEAGHPVEVVELYTDGLGESGSGADSYLGLMLTDAMLIADALGG
jgi:zinc/manganese transport system substrate-binding protein